MLAPPENCGQNCGQNEEKVVTLTFASWNQIGEWLRRFNTLRQAG
jgi:hypothetical protein